jgi:diguanylate cyclase (GGDEF)-like protein
MSDNKTAPSNNEALVGERGAFNWDFEKGYFQCFGNEQIIISTDPDLKDMLAPIADELGIDLFRLIVANSSIRSTNKDYKEVISSGSKSFAEGFSTWSQIAALTGWGSTELSAYEPENCHAIIIINNPWELRLQKNLPKYKHWGCPFLLGKMIGIFEQALGQNCWASDACEFFEDGTSRVTLTVYASTKTTYSELEKCRQRKTSKQEKQLKSEIEEKTTKLQESNNILKNITHLDFLTNLKNRRCLEETLLETKNNKTWQLHTLMFVDLDQFKVINDTCGHLAGDRLLRIVAERLSYCTKDQCTDIDYTIYRYGGDEYAILLSGSNEQHSIGLAQSINDIVSNILFKWENKVYEVNCSIGIAQLDKISPSVDNAIITADNACYQAKKNGRNQYYFVEQDNPFIQQRLIEMGWVHKVKEAVKNNQFTPHFQLLKPLDPDNKKLSLEALIRMNDENNKLIMPTNFLSAAENYDVIFEVDCWMIENICKKIKKLDKRANVIDSIAINLSGNTLSNPKLGNFIEECFKRNETDTSKICFEVTETHMMTNIEIAQVLLKKLQQFGCTISLDDFGAGMSSFGYLKKLPIDKIKIDGSFVKNMDNSLVDYTFVESITNVAKAMGIKTVAEFVENERIVELLTDIEVDYLQGHFIEKPKPWSFYFD